MPRIRPVYTQAFQTDAVELVRTSGKPIPVLAKELGLAEQTLRNWVRKASRSDTVGDALTATEREELRRLRRENRILQQEREILKKAAAFFAHEMR